MNNLDKIDLFNSRLTLQSGISKDRVYDSLEHCYNAPSTVLATNRMHMPENKCNIKEIALPKPKPNVCRIITSSRTITDLTEPVPKTSRALVFRNSSSLPYDLHFNKTAFLLKNHKPRVNSAIVNRVLDRVHDTPQDTLSWCLNNGEVAGGYLPTAVLPRDKPLVTTTEKGPGEYDVDRWYLCERGQLSTPLLTKFTTAPRDDGAAYPYPTDAPPPNKYFSDCSFKPRTFDDHPAPVFGRSRVNRFKDAYKHETHVTTTGLLLPPDYDRKDAWEKPDIPVTIKLKEPQRPATSSEYPTTFINPDSGTKLSISKSSELSPIRYAVAFGKKVPRKRHTPINYQVVAKR